MGEYVGKGVGDGVGEGMLEVVGEGGVGVVEGVGEGVGKGVGYRVVEGMLVMGEGGVGVEDVLDREVVPSKLDVEVGQTGVVDSDKYKFVVLTTEELIRALPEKLKPQDFSLEQQCMHV